MVATASGAKPAQTGATAGEFMAEKWQTGPVPTISRSSRSPAAAIGIFGGTFDPLHAGHVHIARAAAARLPVDHVLWVPSGDPGHRNPPHAAARDRLAMVRAAIEGEPHFRLDTGEIDSGMPTFTVPMLRRLRAQYGADRPLVLISGADSFLSLPSWHEWRSIFGLANIAVAARPGYVLEPAAMDPALAPEFRARAGPVAALAEAPSGRIAVFELAPLDVSASGLRAALAAGERPGADLLPPPVLAYIEAHGLYRGA